MIRRYILLIYAITASLYYMHAQNSYEFSIPEDNRLVDILEQVSETYDLKFAYPVRAMSNEKVVAGNIKCESVNDLLVRLLEGTPITYQILDGNRVLLRKTENYTKGVHATHMEIRGKIMDEQLGQGIAYASIYVDTLGIGVQSDERGSFSLTVPETLSDRTLYVSMLGYHRSSKKIYDCKDNVIIKLIEKPYSLGQIDIKDYSPGLTLNTSEHSISIKNFSRNIASNLLLNDPLRTIQLLPGVSASDDLNSNIKIRGDTGDGTLIILDGIPIYKASHFYGIFSAINGDYLEEAVLYKNTLPVAYGGKTGGMLKMNSSSNIQQFTATTEVNLLTSSFSLKAPLGNKLSIFLGGRASYQNVANTKFFDLSEDRMSNTAIRPDWIEPEPSFRFYDMNAKLRYQPNDQSGLDISVFHSYDNFSNTYENEFELLLRQQREIVKNQESFRQEDTWNNLGLSLNYQYKLSHSLELDILGYYSNYAEEGRISTSLSQERSTIERVVDLTNIRNNSIEDRGGKIQLKWDLPGQQHISGGWEIIRHHSELNFEEDSIEVFQGNSQAWVNAGFANYHLNGWDKLSMDLGMRISHYSVTGDAYLAPRLNVSYDVGSGFGLKGAYSINHQFVREVTHENRLGQSFSVIRLSDERRFPVSTSQNIMLGAIFQQKDWAVDVELYQKNISNVVEHARGILPFNANQFNNSIGNNYQVFSGSGTSRGMDVLLTVQKKPYMGWISYTLSKTEQRFDEILRGVAFPAQDDRRHQLKWVNTLSVGKFDFSANYVYISGRPYTDLSLLSEDSNRKDLTPSDRISRLPSYQRIDLGINYKVNLPWANLNLGLSVFNILDRTNVKYLQYIYTFSNTLQGTSRNQIIGTQTDLLNRTLNLSIKFDF